MAMLAEPRQRKRYNLVPRGKPLYADKNRFGTKMLEKMGWEMGKGLGVKEDGTKDFIRIRYKNDELGLGFEHRDDQWTQHEQSFNGLLKTLNNEEESDDIVNAKQENGYESESDLPTVGFGFPKTNANEEKKTKVEKMKEKISGVSLEERSKQSKARVHYKKFTKGKDLAQYSEKDLANIFGKKAADEQQAAANDFYQQLNNTFVETQEEIENNNENQPIENRELINTGVSVNDYFKAKMEALKQRKNGSNNQENLTDNNINCNETQEEEEVSKKKKKKKEKKDQEKETKNINSDTQKQKEDNGQMIYSSVSVSDYFKMKMEALKNKKNGLNNAENIKDNTNACDHVELENGVSKKKKKKKNNKDLENISTVDQDEKSKKTEDQLIEEEPITKNKKEKSKKKVRQETKEETEENILSNENTKKRKLDNTLTDNNPPQNSAQDVIEIDLTEEPRKKKKKKNKTKENESNEAIEIDDGDKEVQNSTEDLVHAAEKKKKKKSKKNKPNENSEKEENTSNSYETKIVDGQLSEEPKKSKKKDVSPSAKNVLITDVSLQALNLDELKKKYNAFNIYPISSFCAEKFRHINFNNFTGSSLPHIEGYSIGPDLQLDVTIIKTDEERITNLWNCILDKYSQLQKPKKTYQHYVREAIKARKTNQKRPKLYVKTWKRKNAFQVL